MALRNCVELLDSPELILDGESGLSAVRHFEWYGAGHVEATHVLPMIGDRLPPLAAASFSANVLRNFNYGQPGWPIIGAPDMFAHRIRPRPQNGHRARPYVDVEYSWDVDRELLDDTTYSLSGHRLNASGGYEHIGGHVAAMDTITATRMYTSMAAALAAGRTYGGHVNTVAVLGMAAGTVLAIPGEITETRNKNHAARFVRTWQLQGKSVQRALVGGIVVTYVGKETGWIHTEGSVGGYRQLRYTRDTVRTPYTESISAVSATCASVATAINARTEWTAAALGVGTESADRLGTIARTNLQPGQSVTIPAYIGDIGWNYAWNEDAGIFESVPRFPTADLNQIWA